MGLAQTLCACVIALVVSNTLGAQCYRPNATLGVIVPGFFLKSTGSAGNSFTISDIVLKISSSGLFEILQQLDNGTSVQMWNSSTPNLNCTPSCRLSFQHDGNFVLYDSTGPRWSTGTCNACGITYANAAIVSGYPPYLGFFNSSCVFTWTPSNVNPRIGFPPATFNTGFSSRRPIPLNDVYRKFGVCTHIDQGWSYVSTLNETKFIGASTIREGVFVNIVSSTFSWPENITAYIKTIEDAYTASSGSIVSIEGFNEINNWPFSYNGIIPGNSIWSSNPNGTYLGMSEAMQDLYKAVKSSNILKNVPVYHLTAGASGLDSAAVNLTQISGQADYMSIHTYPGGGDPMVSPSLNYFATELNFEYPNWNSDSPRVITEVGYFTLTDLYNGVSDYAQSKLLPSTLFNAIFDGFTKVFFYELWDESWGNPSSQEEHFGMFYHNHTAKPSAEIFHKITTLLDDLHTIQDTSSFQNLENLNFSISEIPQTGRFLLFKAQNSSDVIYWLAVWNNIPVWDPINKVVYSNPSQKVGVHLGTNSHFPHGGNFDVYDVYQTPTSTLSYANVNSVSLDLYDTVVLIRVQPSTQPNQSTSSTKQKVVPLGTVFALILSFCYSLLK